eukprot:1896328-Rhodomonas_salina.1
MSEAIKRERQGGQRKKERKKEKKKKRRKRGKPHLFGPDFGAESGEANNVREKNANVLLGLGLDLGHPRRNQRLSPYDQYQKRGESHLISRCPASQYRTWRSEGVGR